jgi:uncharacterized protein (TIGR02598 family)
MRFFQKNRVNPQNKGARPSRPCAQARSLVPVGVSKLTSLLTGGTPVLLSRNFFTTVANSRSGFSLIEVTIAIGIVGFAVLALLGTLGVGTRTLGSAVSYSMQAQITQNVMGSLKLSDFTMLTNNSPNGWNGANLYFDERGVSITNASLAIYTATVNITPSVTNLGAMNGNTNLARATLSIVKNNNTNDTYTVATFIANNGQ